MQNCYDQKYFLKIHIIKLKGNLRASTEPLALVKGRAGFQMSIKGKVKS